MSTDPLIIENADVKRAKESPEAICPACGSADIRPLPELADRSMLSDGRIVPLALRRHACCACGLAAHAVPPSAEVTRTFFASGYDLYAHPAGNKFERERQRRYAAWISSLGDSSGPRTVFEIGCGNGSLLIELQSIWPSASFAGVEPAAVAAGHARQAGFAVAQGFLESGTGPENAADLVLSVNVLEHASDPARFLQYFRDRMAASGRGIIICPDGDLPSSELLIFDHLHSFTEGALSRFIAAAGLKLIRHAKAPAGLAGFQAAVVQREVETLQNNLQSRTETVLRDTVVEVVKDRQATIQRLYADVTPEKTEKITALLLAEGQRRVGKLTEVVVAPYEQALQKMVADLERIRETEPVVGNGHPTSDDVAAVLFKLAEEQFNAQSVSARESVHTAQQFAEAK